MANSFEIRDRKKEVSKVSRKAREIRDGWRNIGRVGNKIMKLSMRNAGIMEMVPRVVYLDE